MLYSLLLLKVIPREVGTTWFVGENKSAIFGDWKNKGLIW